MQLSRQMLIVKLKGKLERSRRQKPKLRPRLLHNPRLSLQCKQLPSPQSKRLPSQQSKRLPSRQSKLLLSRQSKRLPSPRLRLRP